jgi:hypothetical protein
VNKTQEGDEEAKRLHDLGRLIEAAREMSECHSCLSNGHGDVRLLELKAALDIYDKGRCPVVCEEGPFGEEWCYPCHLPKGHDGWHRHETAGKLVTWEA